VIDETTLMKTLDKIWIKIQKDAGKNKWKKKKSSVRQYAWKRLSLSALNTTPVYNDEINKVFTAIFNIIQDESRIQSPQMFIRMNSGETFYIVGLVWTYTT
jgi:hypothetical protein